MPLRKTLTKRARQLRHHSTDVEKKLWAALRARRFAAFKFRRQQPLLGFVLDFYCYDLALGIELDGGQHDLRREKDAERTAALARAGVASIRFWNNEVIANLEGVLQSLEVHLIERQKHLHERPAIRSDFQRRL